MGPGLLFLGDKHDHAIVQKFQPSGQPERLECFHLPLCIYNLNLCQMNKLKSFCLGFLFKTHQDFINFKKQNMNLYLLNHGEINCYCMTCAEICRMRILQSVFGCYSFLSSSYVFFLSFQIFKHMSPWSDLASSPLSCFILCLRPMLCFFKDVRCYLGIRQSLVAQACLGNLGAEKQHDFF